MNEKQRDELAQLKARLRDLSTHHDEALTESERAEWDELCSRELALLHPGPAYRYTRLQQRRH